MAGSVMSPNYVPQTSRRQLGLGALRGLLDATPVGIADAVQSGINNMQSPVGAALRAVTGKAASPGDVLLGKLGLLGSGSGYDAGRFALNAAFPAMGLLGNQAGGAIPKGYARNQSGAIVWHGSPHKFDRFDASKIGTGEGTQAYGHGLYFAESPEVARTYSMLAAKPGLRTGSARIGESSINDSIIVLNARKYTGGDVQALAGMIENNPSAFQNSSALLARIKEFDGNRPPSYMYKGDLPDDQIAKMLDYDKPIKDQASILEIIRSSLPRDMLSTFDANAKGGISGANAYKNWLWNGGKTEASKAEAMRQAGIPGIRYLDGGSRGAGSGTSNFVVFPGNEGLLNILERNGQPIR
jgi:hypothetical protein